MTNAPERVELRTERLVLRRARDDDALPLFLDYTGDPECARFLRRKPHARVGQTGAMLAGWFDAAWRNPDGPFGWVVARRDDDGPIGVFIAMPDGAQAEIHYGLARAYWGRGSRPRRAGGGGRAWRRAALERLWTFCDVDNLGSRRVLERLGFVHEGVRRGWVTLPAYGDAPRDCDVFGRSRQAGEAA
ncbi:GNAT family N-acetyltransferase [Burkholderia sp. FERM BP-3421]|uniref:GNAT family N-acetyltransferase n=1 Tax=Burkholderia sp. FERM BP-3421 TaxID=1494466 RepID=UPI002360176F|nr:GNAT family N-acetyltransferase [Burkholderia sp. FERM BP-3421]WDD91756.1 GNAT family N-acetyltransferase [Burkholderia sp. FERM BP-3421]